MLVIDSPFPMIIAKAQCRQFANKQAVGDIFVELRV